MREKNRNAWAHLDIALIKLFCTSDACGCMLVVPQCLLPGLNCIIAQICCVPQRSFAQAVRNTHTEPLPVDFKRRYSEFQQELKKNTKHGQSSSEKFFSTQLLPAPSPGAVVSPRILQKTVSSYSTKKEKGVARNCISFWPPGWLQATVVTLSLLQ